MSRLQGVRSYPVAESAAKKNVDILSARRREATLVRNEQGQGADSVQRLRICDPIEVQFSFEIQCVSRKQPDCRIAEIAFVPDIDDSVPVGPDNKTIEQP